MTSLYSMVERPDLESPVLIIVLKGWIDAGLGADGAADVLTEHLDRRTVARFDADALLDQRARRPTMHLVDGVNTQLTWEATELSWAKDGLGHDVLLLLRHRARPRVAGVLRAGRRPRRGPRRPHGARPRRVPHAGAPHPPAAAGRLRVDRRAGPGPAPELRRRARPACRG